MKDRLRPNFVSLHCVSRLLHQAQDVGALGFLKVDVVLLRVFHTFSQVGRIDPPLLIRKLLLLTRGGLGDALLVAVPRVIIAESISDLVPLVNHLIPVTKPFCPISVHWVSRGPTTRTSHGERSRGRAAQAAARRTDHLHSFHRNGTPAASSFEPLALDLG